MRCPDYDDPPKKGETFKAAETFLRKRKKGASEDFTLKDVLDFIRERKEVGSELCNPKVASMFRKIMFPEQQGGTVPA